MVVYLDVYFGLNLWMDVVLIGITAGVCGERIKVCRLVVAACMGATIACVLVTAGRKWQLMGMVGSAMLMMRVVFPHMRWRTLLRVTGVYIVVTIFVGGVINWWYFEVLCGGSLSAWKVGALGASAATVCLMGILMKRQQRRREKNTYRVLLKVQGRDIITSGFLDSGNLLCDGLGRPVHICEKEVLGEACEGLEMMEVEYRALSGSGRIKVVCGDRLLVPELNVDMEKPVIGLAEEGLFKDGKCHMLLNGVLGEGR